MNGISGFLLKVGHCRKQQFVSYKRLLLKTSNMYE